jgi:hypothetical protein
MLNIAHFFSCTDTIPFNDYLLLVQDYIENFLPGFSKLHKSIYEPCYLSEG